MGIKHPICQDCDCIKETQKHLCKFPNEWGHKMGSCSGRIPYQWIYKQAIEWVMANYKTLR